MDNDHYELLRKQWQTQILTLPPKSLVQKLPFLIPEENFIRIPYMNKHYILSLHAGVITEADRQSTIELYDELNIMTLLWYSRPGAVLSGQWCPFYALKNASPFADAFRRSNMEPFARYFHRQADLLRKTLISLGAAEISGADVAFVYYVFPCIPVMILFWNGDDEFPSQVNFLFDKNATDFIHVESIVTITSRLEARILTAAELLSKSTDLR